jgi:hypothetical protein
LDPEQEGNGIWCNNLLLANNHCLTAEPMISEADWKERISFAEEQICTKISTILHGILSSIEHNVRSHQLPHREN